MPVEEEQVRDTRAVVVAEYAVVDGQLYFHLLFEDDYESHFTISCKDSDLIEAELLARRMPPPARSLAQQKRQQSA